jgi:3-methyladenine DNA glycosylase AlkD
MRQESSMQYEEILDKLKARSNPENVAGMARYGINPENTYGVSIPTLRAMAKEVGRNHTLALLLWNSGIHEARILASLVDNPKEVTEEQMEIWIKDFDSWDVCDQCIANLFAKTPFAYQKAVEWSSREEEFVKRASFAMMTRVVHPSQKTSVNQVAELLSIIKREAGDDRNFVKKAVNWALRHIGKQNLQYNKLALATAKEIQKLDSPSAKWIAADAIIELTGDVVQQRLRKKSKLAH